MYVRNHVPTQKLELIGGRPEQVYEALSKAHYLGDVGCGALLYQHFPSRAGPNRFHMDGPATWATQERRDRNLL